MRVSARPASTTAADRTFCASKRSPVRIADAMPARTGMRKPKLVPCATPSVRTAPSHRRPAAGARRRRGGEKGKENPNPPPARAPGRAHGPEPEAKGDDERKERR